jgi:hypothetical protein
MTPQQAFQFILNLALEAAVPLKNYPQLVTAAQIVETALKPKPSTEKEQ